MNGLAYKEEIKRLFHIGRHLYKNVTDDMLYADGDIYYVNSDNGTSLNWQENKRLCKFVIYHKNETEFIRVNVNEDNTADIYVYEHGDLDPTAKETATLSNGLNAYCLANLMQSIADQKGFYGENIKVFRWDVDVDKLPFLADNPYKSRFQDIYILAHKVEEENNLEIMETEEELDVEKYY